MAQPDTENTQYTEYEDPAVDQKQKTRVSLATNPIYSIDGAPNYEFLSNASTSVQDPDARETSSERSGSVEYENFRNAENRKQGYEFVDAIQSGSHEYQLVSQIGQTNQEKAARYEGLIQGQYLLSRHISVEDQRGGGDCIMGLHPLSMVNITGADPGIFLMGDSTINYGFQRGVPPSKCII